MDFYAKWRVCCHCLDVLSNHADKKCLWESTYFKQVSCVSCGSNTTPSLSTSVVNGKRYFMCTPCNQGDTPIGDLIEDNESLIKEYWLHDTHIINWL